MKINTQIICKITDQEVTGNKYFMQRLFSFYKETENCEIICFDFFSRPISYVHGKTTPEVQRSSKSEK